MRKMNRKMAPSRRGVRGSNGAGSGEDTKHKNFGSMLTAESLAPLATSVWTSAAIREEARGKGRPRASSMERHGTFNMAGDLEKALTLNAARRRGLAQHSDCSRPQSAQASARRAQGQNVALRSATVRNGAMKDRFDRV